MGVQFEWDPDKDQANRDKHGVSFAEAQLAFADPQHVVVHDPRHSGEEERYFCLGMTGGGILTVRFTYREKLIRIFGAGYWREGKAIYEKTNQIRRRP